jgi:hypothetical protein
LSQDGTFFDGEFARIQTEGLPRASGTAGLAPLAHDALGHAVAFRYHPETRVIALQTDKNAVSLRRILPYLRELNPLAGYSSDPIANEDVWERFEQGQPRKFAISLAAATNLAAAEGGPSAIASSSRRVAEASRGGTVRIEVSAPRGQDGLDKNFVRSIIEYFGGADEGAANVTSLQVTSRQEDERADDIINFVDDLLKARRELTLLPGDIDAHYNERRDFLRLSFDENLTYIRNYYGEAA